MPRRHYYYPSSWQKIDHNYLRRTTTLGNRLKIWCKKTGVSYSQLADACAAYGNPHNIKFYAAYISNYANDVCTPKMDKLTVMCHVMGVPRTWLLGYGPSGIPHYTLPAGLKTRYKHV